MNAAQWLVNTLRQYDVEYVFALCGNGLAPLLDAFIDSDIQLIEVRNEQAASYMADAWGRMTGRLGVVLVSSGPGFTNAITGLANAFWDGGPMLLLSGSSRRTESGEYFQAMDQARVAEPICKYSSTVENVSQLPPKLSRALQTALAGRPGPTHLAIPLDVSAAEMPEALQQSSAPLVPEMPSVDSALARSAAELLLSARKPIILLGNGPFYAHAADNVQRLAHVSGIPMFSNLWSRGCVSRAFDQYVGLALPQINPACTLLNEADVVLTLGAQLDYRIKGFGSTLPFSPHAKFIRVGNAPCELAQTVDADLAVTGNIAQFTDQLCDAMAGVERPGLIEWCNSLRAAHLEASGFWAGIDFTDDSRLAPFELCKILKPFLADEISLLIDAGSVGRWAHLMLFDRHPSHWLTCGASGSVGMGFSAALAVKLARPDHPLLMLSGDGAAGFNLTEIETAIRYKTPYVAVIAQDNAWGIVADGQSPDRRIAIELPETRFERVAEALGARGVLACRPDQLRDAIDHALKTDELTVIRVPIHTGGIEYWKQRLA